MKKTILLVSLLLLFISTNAPVMGEPPMPKYKIALSIASLLFDFTVDLAASAKKTADEMGIDFYVADAQLDISKQSNDITNLINQGYDLLIIEPVESNAIISSIQEANKANIPVITVDTAAGGGKVVCHIGSDNKQIGREAGKFAVERLRKKYGEPRGKVITMGAPQLQTMKERVEGFVEIIKKYPKIELLQEANVTKVDSQQGERLADNLLTAYPKGKIDILYASNAGMAVGAISAVMSAGRKEIEIVAVDVGAGITDMLLKDTALVGTVAQYPSEMGSLAIENAIKYLEGKKVKDIATTIKVITRDNVKEFLEEEKRIAKELERYK